MWIQWFWHICVMHWLGICLFDKFPCVCVEICLLLNKWFHTSCHPLFVSLNTKGLVDRWVVLLAARPENRSVKEMAKNLEHDSVQQNCISRLSKQWTLGSRPGKRTTLNTSKSKSGSFLLFPPKFQVSHTWLQQITSGLLSVVFFLRLGSLVTALVAEIREKSYQGIKNIQMTFSWIMDERRAGLLFHTSEGECRQHLRGNFWRWIVAFHLWWLLQLFLRVFHINWSCSPDFFTTNHLICCIPQLSLTPQRGKTSKSTADWSGVAT